MLGNFRAFLLSADFFQNQLFPNIILGIPSECQTDWIQIRPDNLSGLIWVQTVCKGYQQTTQGQVSTVNSCMLGNFHAFLSSVDFFKISFFEKLFQEYHLSVKQFGSRSGVTFWQP